MSEWTEQKHRDGGITYKLVGPLVRGQHRPLVSVLSPAATAAEARGQGRWGNVFATARSGYVRQFHDVDEAKAWASRGMGEG